MRPFIVFAIADLRTPLSKPILLCKFRNKRQRLRLCNRIYVAGRVL